MADKKSKPKNFGVKPGEKPKDSGIFEVKGPRGGHTGIQKTLNEDKSAPPTPKPKETFDLIKKTKHQPKKK